VDAVFANMYLHHVEDPAGAIAEMARLLKPGGRLVITDLDQHQHTFLLTEQHDRWSGFKRSDVRQWFKQAGLSQVRSESIGSNCCSTSQCGCSSASIEIFLAYGERERLEIFLISSLSLSPLGEVVEAVIGYKKVKGQLSNGFPIIDPFLLPR
jgi:SAM-dependent methyltransferase